MEETPFTPEEIEQFEGSAAEAERGYTVEFLDSRPRLGRPREIGDQTAVVVPVRLDPERLARLDARADAEHITRSQLIRNALDRELTRT
jgi:hypothetical protein